MNLFVRIFIFSLILFFSCKKEIDINLHSDLDGLVVEGYIQQGYPSYVFLTRSENYFNSIDSNTLDNISVDNAKVFVERNDGIVHQLTYLEESILDSLGIFSLELPIKGLYIDLLYQDDDFSQIGYEYKLIIEWNGKIISSRTSIPPRYPVDSVWVSRKDDTDIDYKCYIWARVNDPDTLGNSVIIHFKRDVGWKPIDPLFIPCAIPVRGDEIINGLSFDAMFARSGRFASDDDGFLLPFYTDRFIDGDFVRKDIVLLRLSHVDQQTYKFWRSVERMKDANSNPFSEPMNLVSNIDGGFGIWTGYGVSYYYIPVVPDTVIYDTYHDVSLLEMF